MADRDGVWVPEACTLPTVDQPLRLEEFDTLFRTALRNQSRLSESVLRWSFDPSVEVLVRDLTARETQCCSFFTFSFSDGGEPLLVDVAVPPAQVGVLDALATRAASGMAKP